MRIKAISAALIGIAIILLLSSCLSTRPECLTFGETPVCGPFLDYYLLQGESSLLGYPITPRMQDGNQVVQYFENAVLQYPADSARVENVTLQPLGARYGFATEYESPLGDPGCVFFPRHGHHVCDAFYEFFLEGGGIETFGPPISGVVVENGIRTQYFENAKFIWVVDAGTPHVSLAPWGEKACLDDELHCADLSMVSSSPEIETDTDDQTEIALDQFIENYGGAQVFGRKLGPFVLAGDVGYQYYENACILWYPGEGISVAPLGSLESQADPPIPAPAVPADDTLYFPETGHSIVMAFRDHFLAHGGRLVFGLPITEFKQEGDTWLQWFENGCLEWHPENPDGLRVQMRNLGQVNYLRHAGALPALPEAVSVPPALDEEQSRTVTSLLVVPESPNLPKGKNQVVTLISHDQYGKPLAGTTITLYITTSIAQTLAVAPPTDENGMVYIDIGPVDAPCGEWVELVAVAGNPQVSASSQFAIWCD